MEVFTSIQSLRFFLNKHRILNKSIGLIPTMGALHDGHISLLNTATAQADITICSVFVNPTQFNNPEDLAKYPRTLDSDLAMLEAAGCSAVFVPDVKEMYPEPPILKINFGELETVMEGASRPGHFNGVGIVVSRLFNIVQPTSAFFGQKDLQQVAVIRQLIADLGFQLELVVCPTVRENDGLAMSSRNQRLDSDERKVAPTIYKILAQARLSLLKGENSGRVKKTAEESFLNIPSFSLDYFEIVDLKTLQPISQIGKPASSAICVAASLGAVRLIDNVIL